LVSQDGLPLNNAHPGSTISPTVKCLVTVGKGSLYFNRTHVALHDVLPCANLTTGMKELYKRTQKEIFPADPVSSQLLSGSTSKNEDKLSFAVDSTFIKPLFSQR